MNACVCVCECVCVHESMKECYVSERKVNHVPVLLNFYLHCDKLFSDNLS